MGREITKDRGFIPFLRVNLPCEAIGWWVYSFFKGKPTYEVGWGVYAFFKGKPPYEALIGWGVYAFFKGKPPLRTIGWWGFTPFLRVNPSAGVVHRTTSVVHTVCNQKMPRVTPSQPVSPTFS